MIDKVSSEDFIKAFGNDVKDNRENKMPIIAKGCMKCPEHNKCVDAFQIHSYQCNHYAKNEIEFEEWLERMEANNEDHD